MQSQVTKHVDKDKTERLSTFGFLSLSTNIARQPCIFRHSSCHLERMIRGTKREGKAYSWLGSHLKKILAHFSPHYMANHSIFANQTFPNALEPPFSNLYRITIIINNKKKKRNWGWLVLRASKFPKCI